MYTYTFIIPHKNIPSLLKRCLDSIPSRPDIEIIVIDDNSNEESIKELKKLSRKELQIIYTTEDKGAGFARNVGLRNAEGEWIVFADADDVFEPGFNTILDLLLKDSISDIVNFDITSRYSETNEPNSEIDDYHCSKKEYINNPQAFRYITQVPWGKAIRNSFIKKNNLFFEEVKYGNDVRFATLCDYYSQYRQIIPILGYCWMRRKDSLWGQRSLEWAETRLNVYINTGKLMRKLGESEYGEKLIDGSVLLLKEIKKHSYI